jgi:hypothetical protein
MEVSPGKYRGKKTFLLVYRELINAAENHEFVTYREIAKIIGVPPSGNFMSKEVGHVLGEISEDELKYGRPMLSSLAVKTDTHRPGDGFFGLAKDKGLLHDDSPQGREQFWKTTCEQVYQKWEKSPA